ncbi:MAG: hypothetical protein EBS06_07440 [Proteobacteria bacterium]|nr:hypothetical protein [Pseudomonadota bacterium]
MSYGSLISLVPRHVFQTQFLKKSAQSKNNFLFVNKKSFKIFSILFGLNFQRLFRDKKDFFKSYFDRKICA